MNRQFSDKEPMKKDKAGFRHLGQAMLRPRRIAPEFNAPSVSKGKGKGVMAGARFFSSGSTLEPGADDTAGLVVTPDATIDSRPLEQGDQNVTENKKQVFNPFGSDFSVASLNTEK